MKKILILISLLFLSSLFFSDPIFAQEPEEIISLFRGSKKIYDDNIGYETHYYLTGPRSHKAIDGKIRRQFCKVADTISAYEIIKNYEKAISDKGGSIIYLSRNANRYRDAISGERISFMRDFFTYGRVNHNQYEYMYFPSVAEEYLVGKVLTASNDIFISVASATIDNATYYSLVTILAKPMDMGNVSLNVLNEGIAKSGRVAIYDIYFDVGKSEVKNESSAALAIIAKYLKENPDKKFLIVGHTDNTGDFNANVNLSEDRANSMIKILIRKHGIRQEQLTPYGVGSVSPRTSNETKDGRARNRRVELVEL
ncbi:MAG: OmpA family protein [Candidatus Neomarinimicrobiota bacterium]|jgi:outer membrane protein OmpA-like peptidoglycan-associated protein